MREKVKAILTISAIIFFIMLVAELAAFGLAYLLTEDNKEPEGDNKEYNCHCFYHNNDNYSILYSYNSQGLFNLADYFNDKCGDHYKFRSFALAKLVLLATRDTLIDPYLVAPIIVYESGCNSAARNKDSGAFGLMQIHPVNRPEYFVGDLENIIRGVEILQNCMLKYKELKRGLECYGAGEVDLMSKMEQDYVYSIADKIVRDYNKLKGGGNGGNKTNQQDKGD